jgi:hypothetical protein
MRRGFSIRSSPSHQHDPAPCRSLPVAVAPPSPPNLAGGRWRNSLRGQRIALGAILQFTVEDRLPGSAQIPTPQL